VGIFDEFNKAMKKVEEEVKKADLDKQFKEFGEGLNKAGSDLSKGQNTSGTPASRQTAPAPLGSAGHPRSPHPGYKRITAWMKTQYQAKISATSGSSSKKLELEQISAEACSGLSSKAKKGFLDYLKSQNYEQLLK
jgi:hypothetical protein